MMQGGGFKCKTELRENQKADLQMSGGIEMSQLCNQLGGKASQALQKAGGSMAYHMYVAERQRASGLGKKNGFLGTHRELKSPKNGEPAPRVKGVS